MQDGSCWGFFRKQRASSQIQEKGRCLGVVFHMDSGSLAMHSHFRSIPPEDEEISHWVSSFSVWLLCPGVLTPLKFWAICVRTERCWPARLSPPFSQQEGTAGCVNLSTTAVRELQNHNALRAQGTTRFCHYQQVLIHNDVINVTFHNNSRKDTVRKGWGRQMAFIRGRTIELWRCSYFKVTAMTECCLKLRSFKTSWCLWGICPVARMCHMPCFIFIAVSSLITRPFSPTCKRFLRGRWAVFQVLRKLLPLADLGERVCFH